MSLSLQPQTPLLSPPPLLLLPLHSAPPLSLAQQQAVPWVLRSSSASYSSLCVVANANLHSRLQQIYGSPLATLARSLNYQTSSMIRASVDTRRWEPVYRYVNARKPNYTARIYQCHVPKQTTSDLRRCMVEAAKPRDTTNPLSDPTRIIMVATWTLDILR